MSKRQAGFSVIELLAVVGIVGLVAAIAIPPTTRTLNDMRLRNDARAIHNLVGLAKMRAATRFTRERVYVDLTTKSFYVQRWNKTLATWVTDDGATKLSSGISFSFGAMTAPPPNTQPSIYQATACRDGSGPNAPDNGATIANTACVVFNSRGIPVGPTGSPVGDTAFYVTDQTGVYAITLSATPLIRLWWSPASQTSWVQR